jgi:hypothetical protein
MEKKMMVIRNMNELARFVSQGKIFPVISSVDTVAIYFVKPDNSIKEVRTIENNDIPGEYLIHHAHDKSELLENIEEFNRGKEKAAIVIEESMNISLPLKIWL